MTCRATLGTQDPLGPVTLDHCIGVKEGIRDVGFSPYQIGDERIEGVKRYKLRDTTFMNFPIKMDLRLTLSFKRFMSTPKTTPPFTWETSLVPSSFLVDLQERDFLEVTSWGIWGVEVFCPVLILRLLDLSFLSPRYHPYVRGLECTTLI